MTRKHYIELAAAIHEALADVETPEAEQAIKRLAREIAVICKRDNGSFDRSRFLTAAGVAS